MVRIFNITNQNSPSAGYNMGTIFLFLFFVLRGCGIRKKNAFLEKIKEKKGSSLYSFMLGDAASASPLSFYICFSMFFELGGNNQYRYLYVCFGLIITHHGHLLLLPRWACHLNPLRLIDHILGGGSLLR